MTKWKKGKETKMSLNTKGNINCTNEIGKNGQKLC